MTNQNIVIREMQEYESPAEYLYQRGGAGFGGAFRYLRYR